MNAHTKFDYCTEFSRILRAHMTEEDLDKLSRSSLMAQRPDRAAASVAAALGGAGFPLPPLFPDDLMGEADTWVSLASTAERITYHIATGRTLSDNDRRRVYERLSGGAA